MILDEIKGLRELLDQSSSEDFERNNQEYQKLLTKIITPRVLKSFTPVELAGIYGGLTWLSENSQIYGDVVSEDLISGLEDFDEDGNNLFAVLDLIIGQKEFPSTAIDFYLDNPVFFTYGFTEPDWVASKELTEKQFYRLWNCLSDEFGLGFRTQIQKNPFAPADLKSADKFAEF